MRTVEFLCMSSRVRNFNSSFGDTGRAAEILKESTEESNKSSAEIVE